MRNFILLLLIISLHNTGLSQTKTDNITKGYLIALGRSPNKVEVNTMSQFKNPDSMSMKEILHYLNNYIFRNRETVQRDIIQRAYVAVFKKTPAADEVEQYYNTTAKKVKNYNEVMNDFKTYFKLEIAYPD